MKSFNPLLVLLLLLFSLISCTESSDSFLDETSYINKSQSNFNLTTRDSTLVVQNANLDMISFVQDISNFYKANDSYEDLKRKLDPVNHLDNMHPAANDLLFKAYLHLSNNGNNSDLTGEEIMVFFDVMLKNAQSDGINDVSKVDFTKESLNLWGSDVDNLAKGSCKWYQIGCHLSNFWNWLNSSPGNGGQTNLQMIGTLIIVAAGILAVISDL